MEGCQGQKTKEPQEAEGQAGRKAAEGSTERGGRCQQQLLQKAEGEVHGLAAEQ